MSAAVRIITAGVHRHWLLGPVGSNVNQCSIVLRSSTAYRDGVERQRSYLTSHCPTLQIRQQPFQGPTWPDSQLRHTDLDVVAQHKYRPDSVYEWCSV
ncbi:hypothetical protein NDU88_005863 [Pleurodeles waltl]|uniref:Uncharacterized protein n=1 Tax=Pleurodeles waltl TaxID=8319 RepID=A0AAV7SN33_PLEWA|nr:hypothetical protein NDU88_005863 [Pleurodeles waltl]